MINTVKIKENGYLINDEMYVPNDSSNRHYQEVQEWLKTNTPEPEFSIEELKLQKISEINSSCSKQIVSGFTSTALDTATPTTYHYQSEQIDQLNLIGLVSGGVDDVLKCSKDDSSGNPTTWNYELHTIAQLTQVLNDGKAYKINLLTKAADLKAQVEAVATQAELDAIVW
ncbi:hypothetical protein [Sulfurimonas sp. NWX79]|uniref:DUF4376 domain-containing protein n=1 Tax=Campylobacterales TaxID=213849 RepID=UPI0032049CEF|nr:DUF4376 domain-containing protein [Sulfurimonas phage SNW-1]